MMMMTMMVVVQGRRCFLAILLVAAILSLSFSQGFGRKVKVVRHYGRWHSSHLPPYSNPNQEGGETTVGRKMMDMVNDYDDPKANTNPKSGAVFIPPPSPPTPTTPMH